VELRVCLRGLFPFGGHIHSTSVARKSSLFIKLLEFTHLSIYHDTHIPFTILNLPRSSLCSAFPRTALFPYILPSARLRPSVRPSTKTAHHLTFRRLVAKSKEAGGTLPRSRTLRLPHVTHRFYAHAHARRIPASHTCKSRSALGWSGFR